MIKLKLQTNNSNQDIAFETSIFPDKTSQVWKVKLPEATGPQKFQIQWLFENEAELFHVLQLTTLLQKDFKGEVSLDVPYLPYARQDKEIKNESTWALQLFAQLLKNSGITEVTNFDQHSPLYFKSKSAEPFHQSVFNHEIVCFPDKGARARYPHLFEHPYVYFDKVRNQLTGQIEGLSLNLNGQSLVGKQVLIVDDLCDGGGTFVQAAEILKKHSCGQIDLCVSHGLFSKGKKVLFDAGISNIFTTNSLLQNPEGFAVWK